MRCRDFLYILVNLRHLCHLQDLALLLLVQSLDDGVGIIES